MGRFIPVKNRAVLAFVLAAGMAAAVWALSVPLTGKSEPWDSEGPYYLVALALAGAISGAFIPKHLVLQYLGAVAGQAAYELVFFKFDPLFFLGLAFLMGYTLIFLASAALLSAYRTRSAKDAPAS